jgi:tRNA threonylcarbamoyladenosine biosynthesis protein TsaB
MELAIDTSTRYASIGLSSQGESVVELAWRSERNHSVELVPSIRRLLKRAGTVVRDLNAIYIASGPGGFSALRVGMSAAKAMASSLDIPLIAVGTLDIEAQPYLGLGSPVCALVGAGRRRLYIGDFREGAQRTYQVIEHDELAVEASADTLFCGEGVAQVADLIREAFGPSAKISDAPLPTRHAGALGALGYRMLKEGNVADAFALEPLYLRSSQVSTANRMWRNKIIQER